MKEKTCEAKNPTTCRHHGISQQYVNLSQVTVSDLMSIKTEVQKSVTDALKLTQPALVKDFNLQQALEQACKPVNRNPAPKLVNSIVAATEEAYIKEYEQKQVTVTKPVNDEDGWIELQFGEYTIQAKVFAEESTYGIDDGRISKFAIFNDYIRTAKHSYADACLLNYDRGWESGKTPKTKFEKYVYNRVINKTNQHLDEVYGEIV